MKDPEILHATDASNGYRVEMRRVWLTDDDAMIGFYMVQGCIDRLLASVADDALALQMGLTLASAIARGVGFVVEAERDDISDEMSFEATPEYIQ